MASADETGRTLGWKVMLGTARHYAERGETEKADEYFKRALESATTRLGESDPQVVNILVEFAEFYRALGKAAAADVLITRAKFLEPNRTSKANVRSMSEDVIS